MAKKLTSRQQRELFGDEMGKPVEPVLIPAEDLQEEDLVPEETERAFAERFSVDKRFEIIEKALVEQGKALENLSQISKDHETRLSDLEKNFKETQKKLNSHDRDIKNLKKDYKSLKEFYDGIRLVEKDDFDPIRDLGLLQEDKEPKPAKADLPPKEPKPAKADLPPKASKPEETDLPSSIGAICLCKDASTGCYYPIELLSLEEASNVARYASYYDRNYYMALVELDERGRVVKYLTLPQASKVFASRHL